METRWRRISFAAAGITSCFRFFFTCHFLDFYIHLHSIKPEEKNIHLLQSKWDLQVVWEWLQIYDTIIHYWVVTHTHCKSWGVHQGREIHTPDLVI